MYSRAPLRRRSARCTPLDPDWLLQRHLSRDLARALGAHAHGLVLDVGCGERPYTALLPGDARPVCVDLPGGRQGPDVFGAAAALPFASGRFDAAICTQVLEHVPDPGAAVAEIARVLRPGGRLVLTAPQAWFLHEEPHDYFRFTRHGLEALCARAGLRVLEHAAQGGFFAMAGIFLAVHAGSYVQWAAEGRGPAAPPLAPGEVPRWRRLLGPLRVPLAASNLAFAALDAVPQPGIFAVNHLVVAGKGGAAG